jgi:hypothetical protein
VWQHNERATIRHHGNYDAGLTDTVLRGCIHTIRVALADTAATPQYLETVGRQEYRFRLGRVAPRLRPADTRPIVGRQGAVE